MTRVEVRRRQRDYALLMRDLVDHATKSDVYISRSVAKEIVQRLQDTDKDLLEGWLMQHAEQLVWQMINERDRSRRAHARAQSSRTAFARAIKANEEGDEEPLGTFMMCPYVVQDGSRRPLADLTRDDLVYVAQQYRLREKSNRFEATFFEALAKKVPDGSRVVDYFTERRLRQLRNELPPDYPTTQPPDPGYGQLS